MYSDFLYGDRIFGDQTGELPLSKIKRPVLMKYLPYYYQHSELTRQIQRGFAWELGTLNYLYEDVVDQFFVTTATWGLRVWEEELGIPYNPELTDEERREVIIAALRGRGTTTKEMIKMVAESFSGSEVEIEEVHDEYKFIVKFVGTTGVPANIRGFKAMLETIKPAHLNYELEYNYWTWGEYKDTLWGDMKEKTWGEVYGNDEK